MLKVELFNWENLKNIGELDLPATLFDVEVKPHVLSEVIRWQHAKARQGTHMVKTKGLVSGGGKKPFKQKGTGNARQGSNRSPLMPGGGKVFGPVPRSYDYALPKRFRRSALCMALTSLYKNNKIYVYEEFSSDGKTKTVAQKLKTIGLEKGLILDGKRHDLLARATRNLPKVKYIDSVGLNVEDLLRYNHLLISKQGLEALKTRLEA